MMAPFCPLLYCANSSSTPIHSFLVFSLFSLSRCTSAFPTPLKVGYVMARLDSYPSCSTSYRPLSCSLFHHDYFSSIVHPLFHTTSHSLVSLPYLVRVCVCVILCVPFSSLLVFLYFSLLSPSLLSFPYYLVLFVSSVYLIRLSIIILFIHLILISIFTFSMESSYYFMTWRLVSTLVPQYFYPSFI